MVRGGDWKEREDKRIGGSESVGEERRDGFRREIVGREAKFQGFTWDNNWRRQPFVLRYGIGPCQLLFLPKKQGTFVECFIA